MRWRFSPGKTPCGYGHALVRRLHLQIVNHGGPSMARLSEACMDEFIALLIAAATFAVAALLAKALLAVLPVLVPGAGPSFLPLAQAALGLVMAVAVYRRLRRAKLR